MAVVHTTLATALSFFVGGEAPAQSCSRPYYHIITVSIITIIIISSSSSSSLQPCGHATELLLDKT